MPSFWGLVNSVIREADILLLVLDARLVYESRNIEIERKIREAGKPLVYVVSKSDLTDREEAKRAASDLRPMVLFSAKDYRGVRALRKAIVIEAKRLGKEEITVGVLGYPNVGKSSLINALKGRGSAGTSPLSGYTRGLQKIRLSRRIMLIDTPGVIPYKEKDFIKQSSMGTIDFLHTREPDIVVAELMARFPEKFERFYGIKIPEDPYDTIEELALKHHVLKKGGEPDMMTMARRMLIDWQKGRIT